MLSRDVGFYTFPFAKESPFLEPVKNVLIQMKKHGILDIIWKRHQVNIDHTCEEKKVKAYFQFQLQDSYTNYMYLNFRILLDINN